jgi:hypothetical protein
MRIGALLGQIDPNQVIPAAAQLIPGLTPTPDNPLGIPGLGGPLVVPQLPGVPQPGGLPIPGGQTDPNKPRVDPLPPGGSPMPSQPSSPAASAADATMGIVPVLAAAGAALVIGFMVARVTA